MTEQFKFDVAPDRAFRALKSGAHSGTSHLPKSIYRRLCDGLRRRWGCSLVRRVVEECRNLPCRIAILCKTPHLRFGPSLPTSPWDHSPVLAHPLSSFVCGCSEGIRQLRENTDGSEHSSRRWL